MGLYLIFSTMKLMASLLYIKCGLLETDRQLRNACWTNSLIVGIHRVAFCLPCYWEFSLAEKMTKGQRAAWWLWRPQQGLISHVSSVGKKCHCIGCHGDAGCHGYPHLEKQRHTKQPRVSQTAKTPTIVENISADKMQILELMETQVSKVILQCRKILFGACQKLLFCEKIHGFNDSWSLINMFLASQNGQFIRQHLYCSCYMLSIQTFK